ncbi:MAG TPA: SUMF1/EgtB/PvdO family nonheme iron enzyme [Polyangiaceae bacterium]
MTRIVHAFQRRSLRYGASAALLVTGVALAAATETRHETKTKTRARSEAEAVPACRPGMKLVSGDYCTKVEQQCLKSWYDESNEKTVCERFDPDVRCAGKKVPKRFCMDTYEWPNSRGKRPEVMNRFHQAQVKCAAAGKRLCTESEWTVACEGPKLLPFPYGFVRDTKKCHGDVAWDEPDMKKVARRDPNELARLWRGVKSGSQPSCVSAYGVADLPGNADEVVASETFDSGWRGKYDSVHTGGPWYKGVRNQCRPKVYTHDEGFYYYFLSFRCCAEADGKPTDPRTPKQIRAGWTMKTVERKAGFTVADMKQKLTLKRRGKCTCDPKDMACKTQCGTLLGANVRDGK